ncbi:c-type cytochrome [Roseitranquillus sediminis]|uniref:c-type cytochrome n=1 Tax=Roseitranquillus sediminis TaxID=2809051 RepID=UPI001D0CC7EA|nr:cytochrome c [Roseitranquillus sediminis]MBM9595547.1 cytochrome c [Roseitranquillus sediminis]
MTRAFYLFLAAAALTGPALAQDTEDPATVAHEMRERQMQLFAYNLGPLGGMARGDIAFDGETAALHAGNIASLASVDFSPYWVEGSSNEELEDSRALPAIWENLEDVEQKRLNLVEAAQALEAAAGEGPEAFGAAFRNVGQACGGCHEDYREPDED